MEAAEQLARPARGATDRIQPSHRWFDTTAREPTKEPLMNPNEDWSLSPCVHSTCWLCTIPGIILVWGILPPTIAAAVVWCLL